MDIATFVEARLAEKEALALAAGEDDAARTWTGSDNGYPDGGVVYDGHREHVVYDEGSPNTAQALHIAASDPATALREIVAMRAVMAAWNGVILERSDAASLTDLYYAVQNMAGIWSGHPDYQPKWAAA